MADLAAASVCCPAASHSSGLADRVWKQDNQIIWLDYFFLYCIASLYAWTEREDAGVVCTCGGASGGRKCWFVSCFVIYLL